MISYLSELEFVEFSELLELLKFLFNIVGQILLIPQIKKIPVQTVKNSWTR